MLARNMNIVDLFYNRPRAAQVACLALLLLGGVSLTRLGIREYPFVGESAVAVSVSYPNAAPETVESRVTQILEDALSSIDGVDLVTATSASEQSNINITFLPGTNASSAAADVRDRISRVRGRLPSEIDDPVISKASEDDTPVVRLAFMSNTMPSHDITDYINRNVRPVLSALPGVADISMMGSRTPAIRVRFNPQKVAAAGLTPDDITRAVAAQNIEQPAGRLEGQTREQALRLAAGLNTPEALAQVVLKQSDAGGVVRLGDVATITRGAESERTIARFNGQNTVQVGVVPTSDADTPTLSARVREVRQKLQASLPPGLELRDAYDTSGFVVDALYNVVRAVIEATLIVMAVMLLFLRSWRAGVAPMLALPIALIGTAVVLKSLGYTLNLLTLTAAVPAAGLVVDDAVVVTENIVRRRSMGLSLWQAARQGAAEIMPAVLTMTLVTPAAFLPLFFMSSRTGKLLSEFAAVLSVSVIFSGICAAILIPRVCNSLLSTVPQHDASPLLTRWGQWLGNTVQRPKLWFTVAAASIALGGVVYTQIPQELAPTEDRGAMLITGILPDGSSPAAANRAALQFENILSAIPERDYLITYAGTPDPTAFRAFLVLRPTNQRTRDINAVAADVRQRIKAIAGAKTSVIIPAAPARSLFGKPVQIVLGGTESRQVLYNTAQQAIAALQKADARFLALDTDMKPNTPRPDVIIDRERAASAGVSVTTIADTISALTGQIRAGEYTDNDRRYRIVLETEAGLKESTSIFNSAWVRNNAGVLLPLNQFITVVPRLVPQQLSRYDRAPSVTISANLAAGLSLGDALNVVDKVVQPLLPANVTMQRAGSSRDFSQTAGDLALVMPIAVLCVLGLLTILFESYRAAFVVLATVPLTISAALVVLYLTGQTLNLYTQAGLLTLVGLVTKHGTLLVDTALHLQRSEKYSASAAIKQALEQRLRPILMTTVAMVAGTLPLLWASGAGAVARFTLGVTLTGGLVGGTLLTMLCIGVFYTAFTGREA